MSPSSQYLGALGITSAPYGWCRRDKSSQSFAFCLVADEACSSSHLLAQPRGEQSTHTLSTRRPCLRLDAVRAMKHQKKVVGSHASQLWLPDQIRVPWRGSHGSYFQVPTDVLNVPVSLRGLVAHCSTACGFLNSEQGIYSKALESRLWSKAGGPNLEPRHGPRLFWRVKEEEAGKSCFSRNSHQNKLQLLRHAATSFGDPHIAAGSSPNRPLVSTTLSRFSLRGEGGSHACPLIARSWERRRSGFHR